MIKRKRIWKQLSLQFDGIQQHLAYISEPIDKEKLHSLRVCSKKVKAITAFLEESLHDKKRYSIKELKQLFHHAGDIRTAQMNLEIIQDNDISNESFEKKQHSITNASALQLTANKQQYSDTADTLAKRVKLNVRHVSNKKIITFYHRKIQLLSDHLRVIDESRLHDNRKIIKILLYNMKLCPKAVLRELRLNKEYLDNLQDIIGKWHDSLITLHELKITPTTTGQSIISIEKVKHDLLARVIDETRDFDSKVILAKTAK